MKVQLNCSFVSRGKNGYVWRKFAKKSPKKWSLNSCHDNNEKDNETGQKPCVTRLESPEPRLHQSCH